MTTYESMDFLNNQNLLENPHNSLITTSGQWDTEFLNWTGIKLNPNEESSNIPISSNYYTIGELVFFNIHLLITNPLSWGILKKIDENTNTIEDPYLPWRFKLPFKKRDDWELSSLPVDNLSDISNYSTNFISGRYVGKNIKNPNLINEKVEEKIVTAMFGIISFKEYLYIYGLDSQSNNLKTPGLKNITSEWPVNFNESDKEVNNSSYLRLSISGVYRKENL